MQIHIDKFRCRCKNACADSGAEAIKDVLPNYYSGGQLQMQIVDYNAHLGGSNPQWWHLFTG